MAVVLHRSDRSIYVFASRAIGFKGALENLLSENKKAIENLVKSLVDEAVKEIPNGYQVVDVDVTFIEEMGLVANVKVKAFIP